MDFTLWSIPGFLGLTTDWDHIECKQLVGINLHSFCINSLSSWALHFNQWIAAQKKINILMGYSLGGRLALHALVNCPQLWQGAIIVSAHPGFINKQERVRRLQLDCQWSERFQNEDWSTLMNAWNEQKVFIHDHFQFPREEHQYNRLELAKTIIQGSLGYQEDLRENIGNLDLPILWITGNRDQQYCELAKKLKFSHSHSKWIKISKAGHRVPWSHPDIFAKHVKGFLQSIEKEAFLK